MIKLLVTTSGACASAPTSAPTSNEALLSLKCAPDLLAVAAQDGEDHLSRGPLSPAPIAKSPFSWGNRVRAAALEGFSRARPWELVYSSRHSGPISLPRLPPPYNAAKL
jgi:hypothetical protein